MDQKEIAKKKKEWARPVLKTLSFKKTFGGGPNPDAEDMTYNRFAS